MGKDIRKLKASIPYHIGCSSWNVPSRVGTFYTKKSKPSDLLVQYASVFNSVEICKNISELPTTEELQFWDESTPDGFKFCINFPKELTHKKLLENVEVQALAFVDSFESIRNKLGPFLIRLPRNFDYSLLKRLEELLSLLPKTYSYAVEVQHADFFDHGNSEHKLELLLKSYGVDRFISDTRKLHATKANSLEIENARKKNPSLPVRFGATASRPVIRYLGTNDILNNEVYLREWTIVVADWIKERLHPYVIIQTPDVISEPLLCSHFHHLLSELIQVPPLEDWPVNRQAQLGLF